MYHANLLKLWRKPEGLLATLSEKEDLGRALEESTLGQKERWEVPIGRNLTAEQQTQLGSLVQDFTDIFNEIPGKAKGPIHKIVTLEEAIVRERW